MPTHATIILLLSGCLALCVQSHAQYYGKEIGPLSELHHGVRGRVYAIDSRTIFIKDFHYDGEGPTAYFYVGSSKNVGPTGASRLRDERGGAGPLRRYRGEGVTLSLPDGHTLKDIRWFSVWCDEYAVNFGSVDIPRELEYPKPVKVGALRGVHGVSSDAVVVVDAQTLLVPNFSYDGEAPDAKFWVGRGDKPSPQGIRIPDENGKETPLRKYDRKTIVLTLPGELTVFDIGHFGVWCEAFTVNFGHVTLPRATLRNIPPSLKMLGVSPQSRNKELVGEERRPSSVTRRPRPGARVDATTYRPHLPPGAGPLAALLHSPAHSSLHRRADTYSPPPQQLLQHDNTTHKHTASTYNLEKSEEVYATHLQEPLYYHTQQQYQAPQQQQQHDYQAQQHQQQIQQYSDPALQQYYQQPQYQNSQPQYVDDQTVQQQYQDLQQQRQLSLQQVQYQHAIVQQPLYQQFQQQQYEQAPLQYRLIPY